jgi:hypothetical protein
LKPEPTQHNSLDRLQIRHYGYIEARTDTTQQSGQTPDKKVEIKNITQKQFTSRSPMDKNAKHTQMTYTCGHILRNNSNPMKRKSAGGIVTAQSTAEDPLKMVVNKDRNM